MTPRVQRLRQRLIDSVPSVDIVRARLMTLAYQEAEGEPTVSIRGKAMHKLFTEMPISIHPDERIVGSPTVAIRAAQLFPEVQAGWLDLELDSVSTREWDPLSISDADKQELREQVLPYWQGRTIYDWVYKNTPQKTKNVIFLNPNEFPTKSSALIDNFSLVQKGIGTVVPNYKRVLDSGLKGMMAEVQDKIDSLDLTASGDCQKQLFYRAVLTTLEGLKVLAERYASLAMELAVCEQDAQRRKELHRIAEICSRVPYNPPRDLWEAVQSFWFTHLAVRMEESGHSLSPGRFDQYLSPFYEEKNAAEKNDALELIECLFLKFSETMLFSSTDTSKFYTGVPQWQNLNVGGRTENGRDATNPLSYLALEAMTELQVVQPDISVRVHPETPQRFLLKACQLAGKGTGHPKFYNEDLIAHSMAAKGISLEESRNFSIMGCVEPRVTGKEGIHLTGGFINLPAAVELSLTGGRWRFGERRVGPATGEGRELNSFQEVMEAFKTQLSHMIHEMFVVNAIAQVAYTSLLSSPFLSAITEGCLEKGADLQHGGAVYNFGPAVNGIGIADTVDSLFALKHLVFEECRFSMGEMMAALDKDFQGHEELRNALCSEVPKFGNDLDEVDELGREVVQFFNRECMKYKNIFGGTAQAGIIPVTAGIPFGKVVGALPSGRKAGTPLADGSSPSHGNDKKGPTAVLRSVAKLDLARLRNGDLLNMRISPTAIQSREGLGKFADFIRGFCDVGGWHIQFNVVDTALLRDAQEHPDKYTDLLVRVAGYSAYFNQLHKEVQEDIIRRTEHCL